MSGPLDSIAVAPAGPESAPVVAIAAPLAVSRRAAAILDSAGIPVVAVVEDATLLRDACGHRQPQIVVLAAGGAPEEAVEDVRAVRAALPRSRVVIVLRGPNRMHEPVHGAVDGAVLEAEMALALPIVVWAVALGQSSMPLGLRVGHGSQQLSAREREVLALAVDGMGNAAIAARLCVSGSTVKTHLASAFSKLGVHSRKEAAVVLREQRSAAGTQDVPYGRPVSGHIANGGVV